MSNIVFTHDSFMELKSNCSFTINDVAIIMVNAVVSTGGSDVLTIKVPSDNGESVYCIVNGAAKRISYDPQANNYSIDSLGVGTNVIVGYIKLGGVNQ